MSADLRPLAYSLRAAAPLVGLSHEELRKAVHAGDLDAKKRGRRYLITHAALERFIEGLPAAATQPGGASVSTSGHEPLAHSSFPSQPAVAVADEGSDARNVNGEGPARPSPR